MQAALDLAQMAAGAAGAVEHRLMVVLSGDFQDDRPRQ
jgi:hypothetical protein